MYGLTLWGGACNKHVNKVYLVQKRFIKAITFSTKGSRCTPLFTNLKLLKLCNIYKMSLLNVGFKYFKQNYCNNIFEPNQHNHNTRNANLLLKIPVPRCLPVAQSAHFKVPHEWNSLVNSNERTYICNSQNVQAFKKSIKLNLFQNQI